jgi:hypothetical protein
MLYRKYMFISFLLHKCLQSIQVTVLIIYIQEDLWEMEIEGWRRKAQDRDQWRRIAQEAKAHVGL